MVGHVELRDDFKEQAEWRREKAEQYPDDKRHLEAAAIFDRLAATVDAIPQDVFIAFSKLEVDDGLRGRPGGDGLLLDPLEFVSGSKSAIQRVEEARLKGV